MISLADWAQRQKSASPQQGFAPPPNMEIAEDDAAAQDEFAELVNDWINLLQVQVRVATALRANQQREQELADMAAKLVADHAQNMQQIQQGIERQLTALFAPLLSERLNAKAVLDFCTRLEQAAAKDSATQLIIAAPPALQEKLRQALAHIAMPLTIEDSADGEISAHCGSTEITTEIAKWQKELQDALAP